MPCPSKREAGRAARSRCSRCLRGQQRPDNQAVDDGPVCAPGEQMRRIQSRKASLSYQRCAGDRPCESGDKRPQRVGVTAVAAQTGITRLLGFTASGRLHGGGMTERMEPPARLVLLSGRTSWAAGQAESSARATATRWSGRCPRGLSIDNHLEPRGPLHRQLPGPRALEDPVHVSGGLREEAIEVRAVAHQETSVSIVREDARRRRPTSARRCSEADQLT